MFICSTYIMHSYRTLLSSIRYGYSRPPFAIVTFKPDTVLLDQPYDIVLDLQVPLSPANLNLGASASVLLFFKSSTQPESTGNFMTVLDLKTAQNETVYYVSRPVSFSSSYKLLN